MHVSVASSIAVCLAGACTLLVAADFDTQRWTSGDSFEFRIPDMPDLDQIRTGLPTDASGTPGGMYCVPTSVADLFAYVAAHGFPDVTPGVEDWEDPSSMFEGSLFIALLGNGMNTSPTGGTNGYDAWKLSCDLLRDQASGQFVVTYDALSEWDESITFKEMSRESIRDDAIHAFCYGRYEVRGMEGGRTVLWRTGGHCMALAGVRREGSSRDYFTCDPGDSSSASTQSAFTIREEPYSWQTNYTIAQSTADAVGLPTLKVCELDRGTSDGLVRFLDSRLTIRPSSCVSWSSSSGGSGSTMSRSRVGPSDGTLQTSTLRLPGVPGRGRFALSPRGMAVMLVGNQLWAESRPGPDSPGVMQPVTLPNMELQPSSRLTFCDDRTLVISSGTKVVAFTGLDAGAPLANDDEAPAIRRAWEVDVFFPIGALVPATKTFEPAGGHAVYVFDPDLVIGRKVAGYMEASQQNIIVPKLMGLPPNSAMQTTIVQDRMGTLWFARDLGQINGLLPDGNVLFGSAGGNIEGLSIDDSDQLLAVDNGLVRCLRITPTGLVDAPAGSSPFTGLAVGKGFQALRSSTNYEPRLHSGPRWLNTIDPPPVAACPADVNDDGLVDGGDLSAVLATWGPSTPGQSNAADLNGDGLVDGNDLSAILATWGPCPR